MDFKFDLQRFADVIYQGQLKFGADNDSSSMFALNLKINTDGSVTLNGSVQEQATPVTYTAPTSGYSYYLPVSVTTAGVVNISALKAYGSVLNQATPPTYEDTTAATTAMAAIEAAIAAGKFSGGITFTSSASQAVTMDLTTVPVPVTVKNAAAKSNLTLKEGDTATAALKIGETVTANGNSYMAAAAGTMTFVGETYVDDDTTDPITYGYATTLQAGTIALKNGETAYLTGATSSNTDDVEVTTTDADGIIVKVAAGKVSSITGLSGANATAIVTEKSVSGTTETRVVTTYTVMDADGAGTMVSKTVETTIGTNPAETVTTYANLSGSNADVTKASYKEAVVTAIGGYGSSSDTGAHMMYYYAGADAATATTAAGATIDSTNNSTRTTAAQLAVGNFVADAGAYYLKVSSSTKAATTSTPLTTTISSVELWQANAEGKLTKVTKPAYNGTVPTIDAAGAAINYTKPKTAGFKVSFTDADIRSKFTNLNLGTGLDSVTTQDGTYSNLGSGTYTVYGGTSVSNTVTIRGKANVTVGDATNEHKVTSITGLDNGETVTFTTTGTTGTSTRTIQATAANKVNITDVTAAGVKTVYKGVTVTNLATTNIFNTIDTSGLENKYITHSVESNLDWTMNGSSDAYFLISGTGTNAKATVKAGKSTISAADAKAGKAYVHVTVDNAGTVTLETITAAATVDGDGNVTAISTTNPATFAGTVTITAPSTQKITMAGRGIADNATLIIKDLAAGSDIDATLSTDGTTNANDKFTTAKLAAKDTFKINGVIYKSGADNNAITIQADKLYSGTLLSDTTTGTTIGVGDYTVTTTAGAVTVTGNAGKTFSLGELSDLDTVAVTKGTSNASYTKYGSYIYDAGSKKMYSLGKNTTISSAALTGTSGWKAYGTSTGAVTVNLSAADTKIAADAKTAAGAATAYDFTVNVNAESTKLAAARTAEVAAENAAGVTGASDFISKAGDVTTNGRKYDAAAVDVAGEKVDQTINVTNGWTVTAAAATTTTINGAASGEDKLIGNTGDDTFNLKGAADTVDVLTNAGGKDIISGYASGKDKIILDTNAKFSLSTTKSGDVYAAATTFADAADVAAATEYVLLQGVGNKAVTINEVEHYFGDGTKLTTGASFTYADGAYYHGNTSGKNILKVGTLKDKASKTNLFDNPITIDLANAHDPANASHYDYIDTVDASGSANEVALTAGAGHGTNNTVGYTLKGGSYKSTLTGGSGADTLVGGKGDDTFDISNQEGKDIIQDYNKSGEDKLLVGTLLTATDVAVSDSDVVIGTSPNTVTIQKAAGNAITAVTAAGAKQTVYVGKGGKDNTFTITATPGAKDVYVGSIGTDTIALKKSITGLTVEQDPDDHSKYTIGLYQGGEIDMVTNAPQYSSIDAVDASGVKATAAALSEYGTKFVKAHAGVKVKGSASGTAFTGSAYDDIFTTSGSDNAKADTVNYNVNSGNDVVSGFSVNDVLKLTGLSAADISSIESAYTANTLGAQLSNGMSFTAGGSIQLKDTVGINSYEYTKSGNTVTITCKA